MKHLYTTLFLFIFPALLTAQSTINSVADGNWTDSAAWDAGVPGENDTAVIEHTVAVDGDVDVLNVTINEAGTLNFPTGSYSVQLSNGGVFDVIGTIDSGNSRIHFLGDGELLGNPTVWGVRIGGGVVLTGSTITDSFVLDQGAYIAQTPGGDPITDESDIPGYTDDTELDFEGEHTISGPEKGWGSSESKNPKSILVNSDAEVTVNTPRILNGLLRVLQLGTLYTNGNVTVTSNGNLFNNWDVEGDITMTRTLNGSEGFRMLASPIDVNHNDLFEPVWTQGFPDGANSPNGDKNIWLWDNSSTNADATNWFELPDLTSQLEQTQGVLIYIFENDDISDQDPGSFPKELSVTGEFPGEPDEIDLNPNTGGFTLVGNPYAGPMTVDLDKSENISNILYLYDPNYTEESGSWLTYDLDSGSGDWDDGVIGPMQSFFVETTGADPEIRVDQTQTRDAEFFGKTGGESKFVHLAIEGEGLKSTAWLRFSESGEMGFDNSDARQLTPLSANYAILATESEEGIFLHMNHLPIIEDPVTLPLITESTKPGDYTLTALQHTLPDGWIAELKDYQTGQITEISEDFSYTFTLAVPAKSVSSGTALTEMPDLRYSTTTGNRFGIIITPYTSVNTDLPDSGLPESFGLSQNYPNPFNPVTVISYRLPVNSEVSLEVYDMLGRRVASLVDGMVDAGVHEVTFDASNLASGVYLYRLIAMDSEGERQVFTRKLTLIK